MTGRRALILAAPHPVSAAVMRGWLAAGNSIAAVWYPAKLRRGLEDADRRLGLFAPQWSVSAVAGKNRIPITLVPRLATWNERITAVRQTGADVLISAYFLNLVPADMLAHFDGQCVNFHPAPLPLYRGPSPIEAMIIDQTLAELSCMTMHVMDQGTDTGPVIASRKVAFPANCSLARHTLDLAKAARIMVQKELSAYLDGRLTPVPQNEQKATYRQVTEVDMALSSALHSEEAEWRCRTYGRKKYLAVEGLGGVRISGFKSRLSSPTGGQPQAGPFHVDMDFADARVRLARRRPWTKHWRKIADYLMRVSVKDAIDAQE